jgi:hypothetical protein
VINIFYYNSCSTHKPTITYYKVKHVYPLKNAVFWVVTPYGSLLLPAGMSSTQPNPLSLHPSLSYPTLSLPLSHIAFLRSGFQFLVTANVVPSSPNLVTLMMETIRSSETSVLTRITRRSIPEDGTLHSHRRKNLKSYIFTHCRNLATITQ